MIAATSRSPFVPSIHATGCAARPESESHRRVSSKYIWIPIQISGTSLTLDDYAQWQLNVGGGLSSSGVVITFGHAHTAVFDFDRVADVRLLKRRFGNGRR
ncbi:MAG TPA: hypothetical protein VIK30_06110 [Polyangia bacterium]